MTPKLKGKIENGVILYQEQELKEKWVKSLEGKEVSVVIKKYKKNRSGSQNKYLWGGVYRTISDFTGYETEDLHNHFKAHFLKKKVGELTTTYSTSGLNTKEFTEYIEKIKRFASIQLELKIPNADEINYNEFII